MKTENIAEPVQINICYTEHPVGREQEISEDEASFCPSHKGDSCLRSFHHREVAVFRSHDFDASCFGDHLYFHRGVDRDGDFLDVGVGIKVEFCDDRQQPVWVDKLTALIDNEGLFTSGIESESEVITE